MGAGVANRRIPPRVLNLSTRFKWVARLPVRSRLINLIVALVAKRYIHVTTDSEARVVQHVGSCCVD